MRTFTPALLAVLAVLLLAAGGVATHDNDRNTTGHDDAPQNGTAAEWATWMKQHMTEQMSADAAAQMQDQMGMSYEEMGEYMTSHQNGSMMDRMMNGRMMDGMMRGGMSRIGCH